jgi:Phosphoenolpyruvate synthase/pyruvate phosphate dikinase
LEKFIFRFNNQGSQSNLNSKDIIGGKGANLAQMAKLKLPVPPGFTLSTKVCEYFYKNNESIPKKVIKETNKEIKIIEKITKKRFGDRLNPLLVSVRSGSRISMPGMMDTVLNLGMNDKTVIAIKNKTSNGRFAKDCYRRFIQMYSKRCTWN